MNAQGLPNMTGQQNQRKTMEENNMGGLLKIWKQIYIYMCICMYILFRYFIIIDANYCLWNG